MGSILIWDSESCPPESQQENLVLWRSRKSSLLGKSVSIPELVEANADLLRSRYLAWIYELGLVRIKEKPLIEHMLLRTGVNYWWSSLIAEKCSFRESTQIPDAIRLLAFYDWIGTKLPNSITLNTSNQGLAKCLKDFCREKEIVFNLRQLNDNNSMRFFARGFYKWLPTSIRALVWLLSYIITRWSLRRPGLRQWRNTSGEITFVSYLANFRGDGPSSMTAKSPYWGPLPEALLQAQRRTNWLFIWSADATVPNTKKASAIIASLNAGEDKQSVHITLDSFLTVAVAICALTDWLILAIQSKALGRSLRSYDIKRLNIWPLFEDDWRESTAGTVAMSNAVYAKLFKIALSSLPKQSAVCYLQENQGWEFIFIQIWKSLNRGSLIGVPHSSVRFWDLRYYFDTRSYNHSSLGAVPIPDKIAINGQAATNAYLAGGYPADMLFQVEALRYLNLKKYRAHSKPSDWDACKTQTRLLVLGDYLERSTRFQMNLLSRAAQFFKNKIELIVAPHPLCPINEQDYKDLSLRFVTKQASELLQECDLVYTSGSTSAALEAHYFRLPILSALDMSILNMSPLRGMRNVFFVSSPEELAEAIDRALTIPIVDLNSSNLFNLNESLEGWRALLASEFVTI